MYSSNQERLQTYNRERLLEQQNEQEQQFKLYAQLAADRGEEAQASNLSRLAKLTFSKLTTPSTPVVSKNSELQLSGFQILKNAIQTKKLDQLIKGITHLDPKKLDRTQRVIVGDLKNSEFKKQFNDSISNYITEETPTDEQLASKIRDLVAGSDNHDKFDNLVSRSRTSSYGSANSEAPTDYTSSTLTTQYGNREGKFTKRGVEELVKALSHPPGAPNGEGAIDRMNNFLDEESISGELLGKNFPKAKKIFESRIKNSGRFIVE